MRYSIEPKHKVYVERGTTTKKDIYLRKKDNKLLMN